ncbi:MAG: 3'(2'),5'-bisphosphate nucleotidase CysQ, partial [Deltaproteobacteria bacterium]|nr:3'(2'),5'-bisphosphate nucleotidase CysQ [Deltaproteobacteria bacterium]
GVVLIPDKSTLYFAEKALGAYRLYDKNLLTEGGALFEGHSGSGLQDFIKCAVKIPEQAPSPRPYTIVGSRSHPSKEVKAFVEARRKEFADVAFVSAGSALKFCLVAEGRADIYPRLGPTMEWDTAAGQMVVEGAGGQVLRHDTGEPLGYNKQDLTNPWFVVTR